MDIQTRIITLESVHTTQLTDVANLANPIHCEKACLWGNNPGEPMNRAATHLLWLLNPTLEGLVLLHGTITVTGPNGTDIPQLVSDACDTIQFNLIVEDQGNEEG